MTKVQADVTPVAKQPPKRMYRSILTAQAAVDVFVRAWSNAGANAAIEAGKGQRMKPRYSKWQVWQESIAVRTYEASDIPLQTLPRSSGLTEQELRKIYIKLLHDIFVLRAGGPYTDRERKAMADAVREFYHLLSEGIRAQSAL